MSHSNMDGIGRRQNKDTTIPTAYYDHHAHAKTNPNTRTTTTAMNKPSGSSSVGGGGEYKRYPPLPPSSRNNDDYDHDNRSHYSSSHQRSYSPHQQQLDNRNHYSPRRSTGTGGGSSSNNDSPSSRKSSPRIMQQQQRNNYSPNNDDFDNRSYYSRGGGGGGGGGGGSPMAINGGGSSRRIARQTPPPPPPPFHDPSVAAGARNNNSRDIYNNNNNRNSRSSPLPPQQHEQSYLPQHHLGGGDGGVGDRHDPIHDIMGAAGNFDHLEIGGRGNKPSNKRRSSKTRFYGGGGIVGGSLIDCGSTISSKADYTLTGGAASTQHIQQRYQNNSSGTNTTSASSSSHEHQQQPSHQPSQQQEFSIANDRFSNCLEINGRTATASVPGGRVTTSSAGGNNNNTSREQAASIVKKLKKDHGFPTGLAYALYTNQNAFRHRMWIVDNSGSMVIPDGHVIPDGGGNKRKKGRNNSNSGIGAGKNGVITRWEELQETVLYHTQMASLLQSQTTFTLLNKPDIGGCPQSFTVADEKKNQCGFAIDPREDIAYAESIISRIKPQGVTPLTQHIHNIHEQISKMVPELRRSGQRVAIILATDGLPTDDDGYGGDDITLEFINSLKSLEGLPVWLVIRLCTDEDKVTDFYNDLDQHLEFSLEVLDDFLGEAREVYKFNKWLNYALPMHRCRELGYHDRLFDLIDERPLTKGELRDMVVLLFGNGDNGAGSSSNNGKAVPNPHSEWKEFLKYIQEQLKKEQEQYNPIKKKMMPWINLKTLHKIYGSSKDGTCVVQ